MSILVIGGDFPGDLMDRLFDYGATEVTHWDGRSQLALQKHIPKRTALVVVLTDYIGQRFCRSIRSKCKKANCRMIYAKSPWIHLKDAVEACDCRSGGKKN